MVQKPGGNKTGTAGFKPAQNQSFHDPILIQLPLGLRIADINPETGNFQPVIVSNCSIVYGNKYWP